MNIQLISSILNNVWAIDEQVALTYSPLLSNILGDTGIKVDFNFDNEAFKAYSIDNNTASYSYYNGWDKATKGSIAVIPLRGPLMKDNQYCGPIGMAAIGSMILEADQHHNIDGIILKIDSPGGTVDGTKALADIIKAANKPIIAFADGLMASAALWVGSAADEIIAADNKTKIGSVGVMLSFQDIQPAYEKLGVKFHNIVATQSKDKNKVFEEIREGNYDNYRKEVLDPLADDFINVMKANRPTITDDLLTGKVYFAEDLQGTIIDSIGDFQSAIERISELINSNNNSISNSQTKSPTMEFTALNKVLGLDGNPESQNEGSFLNDEQLSAINAALQLNNDNADALTAAEEKRDELQTSLDQANQTIASLKQKPGDETAKVIVENDKVTQSADDNVASDKKSFLENMENVGNEYLG